MATISVVRRLTMLDISCIGIAVFQLSDTKVQKAVKAWTYGEISTFRFEQKSYGKRYRAGLIDSIWPLSHSSDG